MELQKINLGKVSITVEEDPWDIRKSYDRLTIVEDNYTAYISRLPVPAGQQLINNRKYWIPFGTRGASISVSSATILINESQLPTTEEENHGPYIIDGVLYIWVGTGGNALDGKYQTINLQGPQGPQGIQGPQGPAGQNGTNGKDGLTPEIGEDGNWWIGPTNTNKPARGEAGTPGTNGKDGKDGKDGKNGSNGANGIDGKNGETPYIGSNGNWWFPSSGDTGQPSRGLQGPQGPPGVGGEGSSYAYLDEEKKRVVLVIGSVEVTAVLYSPPEEARPIYLAKGKASFQVNGNNLTSNVILTVTNYARQSNKYLLSNSYRIIRTKNISEAWTYEETYLHATAELTLTQAEVNDPDGINITVILSKSDLAFNTQCSISVTSTAEEFTERYVNIINQIGYINPNLPGQIDQDPFNPSGPGNGTGGNGELVG